MNGQQGSIYLNSPTYTGVTRQPMRMPQHQQQGFCKSCCHPMSKCCCGSRECRKVSKELLANSLEGKLDANQKLYVMQMEKMTSPLQSESLKTEFNLGDVKATAEKKLNADMASAIIGGGCCVHVSIEYMPAQPGTNLPSTILAMVVDSEGTALVWGKANTVISGYHIKEGIITTNPGAQLKLLVVNAIARLRWCEVFSC